MIYATRGKLRRISLRLWRACRRRLFAVYFTGAVKIPAREHCWIFVKRWILLCMISLTTLYFKRLIWKAVINKRIKPRVVQLSALWYMADYRRNYSCFCSSLFSSVGAGMSDASLSVMTVTCRAHTAAATDRRERNIPVKP